MQEWFDNNDILIYSTHNEGNSVIAERFIKTLKAKIIADYSTLTEKIETNPTAPKLT